MSQSQGEAAIRWAGALTALTAASLLMGFFPALEARAHVVLPLHAGLLLGCAAVLHGAVADLGAPSGLLLRWLGFAGIALYVTGDVVAAPKEATAEAVKAFLLFLMFLVGVSAVYLSMIRERGGPPRPRPSATAAEPEASLDRAGGDHDGGEVNGAVCVLVVDTKLCL